MFTLIHPFPPFCTHFFARFHHIHSFSTLIALHHGDPEKVGVMSPVSPIVDLQPSGTIKETGPIIVNLPVLLRIIGSQFSPSRLRPLELG